MTLPADIYQAASGQGIYGGMAGAASLLSPTVLEELSGTPWAAQDGKPVVFELHGSSGQPTANGRQYLATVSGGLALMDDTTFQFSTVAAGTAGNYTLKLRPVDLYQMTGYTARESAHIGLRNVADGKMYLVSERRYDALLDWADANLTQYDHVRRVLTGGSMGGWGTISYGVRRFSKFAALYADRPRFRYGDTSGFVSIATPESGFVNVAVNQSPMLSDADGGGSFAAYVDMNAYVSNPANKVRPILWCCGRNDGFAKFDEQIAFVDAMRAAGRAFAFAWNDGGHAAGSIMSQIYASYPIGTFSREHGWPLFTEHSLDNDPRVDLVGGINIGLKFDQVIESTSSWSCRITNINAACTVKVKPVSDVFTANVASQLVTIPAAGEFVTVTFTA